MANELRIFQNFLGGRIDNAPLASGGTSLSSPALAAMAAVGSTQHMMVVLDPDGLAGEPEIVKVTAHTAAATTATIVRAQEGTTAREHAAGTDWVHTIVATDLSPDAWIAYTPVWTGTGLTQGNAILKGAYRLVGKTLHLRVSFTFGSTSAASAGGFSFSLPSGLIGKTSADTRQILAGWVFDLSASGIYPAAGYVTSAGTTFSVAVGSTAYGGTSPVTIASGDEFHATGTIEVD